MDVLLKQNIPLSGMFENECLLFLAIDAVLSRILDR